MVLLSRRRRCPPWFVAARGPLVVVRTLASDDVVLAQDGNVSLTAAELDFIVKNAPPTVRSAVKATDAGRFEIVAATLADKKIHQSLENLDPVADADLYHRYQAALRAAAKEFDATRFQVGLEIPDLEELAKERYRISKNEIAMVPEQRLASHILLLCTDTCDLEAKRAQLQAIRERLVAGEPFADLAAEFSQDPGSRQRGGRLSQPITRNDDRIDQTFRDTAFALEQAGDLSNIVQSRFGLHLIKLDEVSPERLYSFEEIKAPLIEEVEKRYREDAYRLHVRSFGPSEAFTIDYPAIDQVLGPVASSPETP